MAKKTLRAKFCMVIKPTRDAELPWRVVFISPRRRTEYRTAGTLAYVEEQARKALARLNKAVRVADLSKL